jgi:hypothetical protein
MSSLSDPRNFAVVWDTPEVAAALDPQRPETRPTPPRKAPGRRPGGR